MNTLFMKCTLVDPNGKADDFVFVNSNNQVTIEFSDGNSAGKGDLVELSFKESGYPSIRDAIEVKTSNTNKMIGYIADCDVKYLFPFYKKNGNVSFFKQTFDCKIGRLNPSVDGAGGISVNILLK